MSLYETILAVVSEGDGSEWSAEAERWMDHPSPDETYLNVGALADAVCDAVTHWLEASRET